MYCHFWTKRKLIIPVHNSKNSTFLQFPDSYWPFHNLAMLINVRRTRKFELCACTHVCPFCTLVVNHNSFCLYTIVPSNCPHMGKFLSLLISTNSCYFYFFCYEVSDMVLSSKLILFSWCYYVKLCSLAVKNNNPCDYVESFSFLEFLYFFLYCRNVNQLL